MTKAFLALLFASFICFAGPGSPPRTPKEALLVDPTPSIGSYPDGNEYEISILYPPLEPVAGSSAPSPDSAFKEPSLLDQWADSFSDSISSIAQWLNNLGKDKEDN